jgi:hypothetical protein
MIAVFTEFIEENVEVFMDDFSVYGKTFMNCLANLDKVRTRCAEVDLVLNWEKCHFMVKLGIVLGHVISERAIEVDKAKVDTVRTMCGSRTGGWLLPLRTRSVPVVDG